MSATICSDSMLNYPNETAKKLVFDIVAKEGIKDYVVNLSPATKKGDNYYGKITRVNVLGKKDGKDTSFNLILKTSPTFNRENIKIERIYERELFCYTNIFPTFDELQTTYDIQEKFKYVKYYGGDLTYLNEIIVMEDARERGFDMSNRQNSLSYEHVLLAIKELAIFHALSFALELHHPNKFKECVESIAEKFEMPDLYVTSFKISRDNVLLALIDKECKKRYSAFAKNALNVFEEHFTGKTATNKVLCHGDCWVNNMLFRCEDGNPVELILLDWQMIKHASPIVDIAYLVFSSTDEKLREKHYFELLDIYYNSLENNLIKLKCDINICYPRQIFEKQIKTIMPFGLIMAFLTAPMFMSEDEDIIDMDEVMKKNTIDEEDMQLKNVKSKERYEERIRGVVKDFVKLDLI